MLFLVIPTTSMAVFMGCRKHKDKWVATLSALGVGILIGALVYERQHASAQVAGTGEPTHVCEHCVRDVSEGPVPFHAAAWINTLGGLFLASGHVRNFRLCRRSRCAH